MSRRSFVSAATLAAVAAVLDGCSTLAGPGGSFSGSYGGPLTVTLSSFGALASVGGVARVDGGNGAPTALYRSGSSSFIALAMICTHQGYYPIDITSSGFYCPLHGTSYNRAGGPTGGFAQSNLQTFATSYNATAGTVTISRPS
ncbi:MAG: ubiquinol-cytochrome c reductase iron-sulfur subunit [Gemmatimonadales bacterium]